MAKRSRSHHTVPNRLVGRSPLVLPPSPRKVLIRPSKPGLLGLIQDNRTWHPAGSFRPAVSIGGRSALRHVVKSKPNALRNDISARIGYAVPDKVVKCIRRKQRKEVLHAKGVAGSRVSRRRRRDRWSDVDCT